MLSNDRGDVICWPMVRMILFDGEDVIGRCRGDNWLMEASLPLFARGV